MEPQVWDLIGNTSPLWPCVVLTRHTPNLLALGPFLLCFLSESPGSASSFHRQNNFSAPKALTSPLQTACEAFQRSRADDDTSCQERLAKLLRRGRLPAGSMPRPSCTCYKGHCSFFRDFQKYFSTFINATKKRLREISVHMDGTLYFLWSKYDIRVKLKGQTRLEEKYENKDHVICVFPPLLGKVFLIHKCMGTVILKLNLLSLHLYIVPSHCQSSCLPLLPNLHKDLPNNSESRVFWESPCPEMQWLKPVSTG